MDKLSVLAFGQSAMYCGGDRFVIEVELPCSVEALRGLISKKFPIMQSNYMIAINHNYASNDFMIETNLTEIAIIPPVSGG